MNNNLLLIPIGIVLIFIIIIIIYLVKRSKKTDEQPTSILDVNEVGVPSSSDFSYGYEKEETVVMNPINANNDEGGIVENDSILNQDSDMPVEDNTVQDNIENNIPTNNEDNYETTETQDSDIPAEDNYDTAENQIIEETQNNDIENDNIDVDIQNNDESEEI